MSTGRVGSSLLQGRTELERRYIRDARWCDANDIAQLVAAGEWYPRSQFSELLPAANRLVDVALDNGAARCRRSAHPLTCTVCDRLEKSVAAQPQSEGVVDAFNGALLQVRATWPTDVRKQSERAGHVLVGGAVIT